MIIRSGDLFYNPFILQLRIGSSLFTVDEVVKRHSYFVLKNCPIILDCALVIHLRFLKIVKKSFEMAILASITGSLFILKFI